MTRCSAPSVSLRPFKPPKPKHTASNNNDKQPSVEYYTEVHNELCVKLALTQTHGHAHTSHH